MAVNVSIIIVSYNTSELLQNCIESIIQKTKEISYEIIVVDNQSTDDSIQMVKEKFPDVELIASNTNQGFGKANNLGVKSATGDYIFFLNSDTILINNAIKILYDFMESSSDKIAACGGNLFKSDGTPNYSYSTEYPSLTTLLSYRFKSILPKKIDFFNHTDKPKEVAVIIGADLFMRKDIFEKLNGFDENFFMYIEDSELQLRLHKSKFSIYSIPVAKIVHLQGKSSVSYSRTKMEITSYRYYFHKHFSKLHILMYYIIESLYILSRLLYNTLYFKNEKRKDYWRLLKHLFSFK